jgi:hypothetical protein
MYMPGRVGTVGACATDTCAGGAQKGMALGTLHKSPKITVHFSASARPSQPYLAAPAPLAAPTPQRPLSISSGDDVRTPAMVQLQDMFPGTSASLLAAALTVCSQNVSDAVSVLLEAATPAAQQALLARARTLPRAASATPAATPATPHGTGAASAKPAPTQPPYCKLSFRAAGHAALHDALSRALAGRQWEKVRAPLRACLFRTRLSAGRAAGRGG